MPILILNFTVVSSVFGKQLINNHLNLGSIIFLATLLISFSTSFDVKSLCSNGGRRETYVASFSKIILSDFTHADKATHTVKGEKIN